MTDVILYLVVVFVCKEVGRFLWPWCGAMYILQGLGIGAHASGSASTSESLFFFINTMVLDIIVSTFCTLVLVPTGTYVARASIMRPHGALRRRKAASMHAPPPFYDLL